MSVEQPPQVRRRASRTGERALLGSRDLLDRLFEADQQPTEVRESILQSWRRCHSRELDPQRLEIPRVSDVDIDGLLHDAARPVLDSLQEHLANESVSVILTDSRGLVLDRRAGSRDLNLALDRVHLATGFSYSEQHVGTNGIGTAAESKSQVRVFGREHYAEWLRHLSCAGAPIRHPTTGRILGIVDLTCFAKDANGLLCAFDREAANAIEKRLLELSGASEQALFHAFRLTTARTKRPVLSVADGIVMVNDTATRVLTPHDQETVLAIVRNSPRSSENWQRTVELTTGSAAVHGTPVVHGPRTAGVIVEVNVASARRPARRSAASAPPPDLAGRSASWRRAWSDVTSALAENRWVLLTGESGVGKSALARAAYRQTHGHEISVIDLAEEPAGGMALLANDPTAVLLRHIEALGATTATELAGALARQRAKDHRLWVAATLTRPQDLQSPDLAPVLRQLGDPIEIPPLRYRVEDLRELIPALLRRVAGHSYRVAPEALRVLLYRPWFGNVDELERILEAAVRRSWSRELSVRDLPAEVHATSHRTTTPLEILERDAIVEALIRTGGNCTAAAEGLGISRATIYRKIRSYGIVLEHYRTDVDE